MKKILPYAALLLLTGCAALGLGHAVSFDQKLAQAYALHTTVVQTTDSALNAGVIKSADAGKVRTMAITSRALLDDAKVAETAADAAGAQSKLQLAQDALKAIQTFLTANQKAAVKAAPAAANKGA